ncbi:hypothetical protein KY285_019586 [Solanum tuberosum]|nr:hypothetical protein KY285_019586 [Solanum tuberosum]
MKIKKEITPQVLHQVNLVISFSETFNYILPYWNLDKAKQLVNGARKGVAMFNEDAGRRYSLAKLTTLLRYRLES